MLNLIFEKGKIREVLSKIDRIPLSKSGMKSIIGGVNFVRVDR